MGKIKVLRISRQLSPIQIIVDQKQPENVEYFNYVGSMINDATCTREIKSRVAIATAAFTKKKMLFTSQFDLHMRKKLVKCCIWSIALNGAETWTLWKVYQKCPESFRMWCRRKTEKINWTYR
ncbi:hypothetical protein Cfor_09992, partial [Coptotermes formosanus]